LAQEEEERSLYHKAKSAYDVPNGLGCVMAVDLFKEYLNTYRPPTELKEKIHTAMVWCESLVQERGRYRTEMKMKLDVYGWCGGLPPDKCPEHSPRILPEDIKVPAPAGNAAKR
jgi:hypothetical protein